MCIFPLLIIDSHRHVRVNVRDSESNRNTMNNVSGLDKQTARKYHAAFFLH